MSAYLTGLGRKVAVVNLDPANDSRPYASAIDIQELITMEEVLDTFQLGPNGGQKRDERGSEAAEQLSNATVQHQADHTGI